MTVYAGAFTHADAFVLIIKLTDVCTGIQCINLSAEGAQMSTNSLSGQQGSLLSFYQQQQQDLLFPRHRRSPWLLQEVS
jgi:hypothetical protein